MSTASPRSSAEPKLLASTATRIRLAAASLAVLALGSVAAPRSAETPLPSPEQGPAPLLGEQMARPAAGSVPFTGVQAIADMARAHTVAVVTPDVPMATLFSDGVDVTRPAPPAGFGVYVTDGFVLTHASALGGRTTVRLATADGRQIDGTVAAAEASTGFVLLSVPTGGTAATLAAALPSAGELAVGAGRVAGRDVGLPVFVTSVGRDRFVIGTTGTQLAPGTPLFSLDGDLLAVASHDGGTGGVFPAVTTVERLVRLASAPARPGVFGLTVQGLDGALATALGDRGVVVTDAIAGGPAATAGLTAGDIIVAIDDSALTSASAAAAALQGATLDRPATFRVLRRGREQSITVTPVSAYALASVTRPPDAGPTAAAVMTGDELAASAVPPDAVVLRVGTTAVTSAAQARRLVAERRGSVTVLVSRQDVRFMTVLPERP